MYLLMIASLLLADPCQSGPQPGQRTGPYSALVCVGKERGTQHCYICENADKPVVIVFARNFSDPLGKLVHKLDQETKKHKDFELKAWVTFLADNQTALDAKVVAWSKQHATGNIPLAVFEDEGGPPSYLLNRDADVTVLVANKQRVVANFAFREGEFDARAIEAVLRTMPKILSTKK